jgi:hypothetical protein
MARQVDSLAFTPTDRDSFSLDRAAALAKVQRAAPPAPAGGAKGRNPTGRAGLDAPG